MRLLVVELDDITVDHSWRSLDTEWRTFDYDYENEISKITVVGWEIQNTDRVLVLSTMKRCDMTGETIMIPKGCIKDIKPIKE